MPSHASGAASGPAGSGRGAAPEGKRSRALSPRAAGWMARALIGVMIAGSLIMWMVLPVAWLWVVSQFATSQKPNAALYGVAGAGIIASMSAFGLLLAKLNRVYIEVTDRARGTYVRDAWQHGASELPPARSHGVLDVIMVGTVIVALVSFLVWFFLLSGSSIDYQV